MQDISELKLGDDDQRIRLETSEENRLAATALAEQARRTIDIFTWDLDGEIYDTPEFIEAIRQLAIRHRHALIRVLVQDSAKAAKLGHRLPYLMHRLPSKVQIRKPASEYKEYRHAFMIADGVGIIRRPLADRYEGELNFKSPMEAKEHLNFFEKVWISAESDPYLRRLNI
jgi:hypothetical protein